MNAHNAQTVARAQSRTASRRRAREIRRRQIRRRRLVGLVVLLIVALATYEIVKASPSPKPIITLSKTVHPRRHTVLANPSRLTALYRGAPTADGVWTPAGRPVRGHSAVFTTTMHLADLPGVTAGVAWMDTKLLSARQYSGSLSPGGLNWNYTAPISAAAARTLVVAFNGGFLMKDTKGGYYAEGKYAAPLQDGAASLVIYKNGSVNVVKWGRDTTMTPSVSSVRQNLVLLIDDGKIAPNVSPTDTYQWGVALNQVVDTWRSGIGVTADGALVYAYGPMNVLDLADVLLRAGAVRAMTLDMNPAWTDFAVYKPATQSGLASPANGVSLLPNTNYGPSRFFSPAYSRDFVTLSAR